MQAHRGMREGREPEAQVLQRNLFFFFFHFINLFSTELGLHCCTWAFYGCSERGPLFVVVPGLLIEVASLVVGSRCMGFRSGSTWAQ